MSQKRDPRQPYGLESIRTWRELVQQLAKAVKSHRDWQSSVDSLRQTPPRSTNTSQGYYRPRFSGFIPPAFDDKEVQETARVLMGAAGRPARCTKNELSRIVGAIVRESTDEKQDALVEVLSRQITKLLDRRIDRVVPFASASEIPPSEERIEYALFPVPSSSGSDPVPVSEQVAVPSLRISLVRSAADPDIFYNLGALACTGIRFQSLGYSEEAFRNIVDRMEIVGSVAHILYHTSAWGCDRLGDPEENIQEELALLQRCAQIVLVEPGKNDDITTRILNAMSLIHEAVRATHQGVRISMACAALEAVISNSKSEITEKLSTALAVLLEPQCEKRSALKSIIKRLYGSRSGVVHGEKPQPDKANTDKVMLLCSATIRAVFEWILYEENTPSLNCTTPDAFIKCIDTCLFEGKPMPGVAGLASPLLHYDAWEPRHDL